MRRWQGPSDLPPKPRVAVIANDALGNFVVATPLLQMIRAQWSPREIVYFGGVRTRELEEASDLFDVSYPLHGTEFRKACDDVDGSFDLVVNVEQGAHAKAFAAYLNTATCGPCLGPRGDLPYGDDRRADLWRDREWVRESLSAEYDFLQSGFIGEIYARLAFLEGPMPAYKAPMTDPGIAVPDVLIAMSASLPEKLWTLDSWRAVLRTLQAGGTTVGLLGAPPKTSQTWTGGEVEQSIVDEGLAADLRGFGTLPQVVGALSQAKRVLTLDNGIMHLAVAAGAKTVGLFRHGIHRLWTPPGGQVTALTPANATDPVASIDPAEVERALGF